MRALRPCAVRAPRRGTRGARAAARDARAAAEVAGPSHAVSCAGPAPGLSFAGTRECTPAAPGQHAGLPPRSAARTKTPSEEPKSPRTPGHERYKSDNMLSESRGSGCIGEAVHRTPHRSSERRGETIGTTTRPPPAGSARLRCQRSAPSRFTPRQSHASCGVCWTPRLERPPLHARASSALTIRHRPPPRPQPLMHPAPSSRCVGIRYWVAYTPARQSRSQPASHVRSPPVMQRP